MKEFLKDHSSFSMLSLLGLLKDLLLFPCSFFKGNLICRLSSTSHLSADDAQTQSSSCSQPLNSRFIYSNGYF